MRARARLAVLALLAAQAAIAATATADLDRVMSALAQRKHGHVSFVEEKYISVQNGVVTIDRGRRHYVLDLHQYPQVVPFIESIRATLAGDRAGLERVFRLSFAGSFDTWTLTLAPLDEKLAHTIRQIDINGTQAAIHKVQIQEADGDRSVLEIGAEVTE